MVTQALALTQVGCHFWDSHFWQLLSFGKVHSYCNMLSCTFSCLIDFHRPVTILFLYRTFIEDAGMVSSAFESLFHKGLLWIADPQQDFSRASSSFIGTARGSSYSHPKTAPFGISEIDSALPDAGLRGAAIHEFFSDSLNLLAVPGFHAENRQNGIQHPSQSEYSVDWWGPFQFSFANN